MAKSEKEVPKKRQLKKVTTLREQAKKSQDEKPKKRRLKATVGIASKPLKTAASVGKKEYYLPLPDNKAGRFLNKRRHIFPRYFINAWGELRQVEWPSRRETIRLTTAVILFAVIFGVIIAVVDYGLDKVFRSLLLK